VTPPPEPKGPSFQPEPKPEPKKPKDKKAEKKKEEAKPSNTAQTPSTETPNDASSSGPAAPGMGSGGAGKEGTTISLGGGMPGGDFYGATVRAAIEARWRKPVLELEDSPKVSIQFDILRDGTVRDVRVVSASGVPALDRSALRAVSEASPLPPFPASSRIPSTTAIIEFELQPE
jgi:protein TonB